MFFSESDTILEISISSRYKPTSCSYNFVKHLLRFLEYLQKQEGHRNLNLFYSISDHMI